MRWWDLDEVLAVEVASFGPDAWSRETYLSELAGPGRTYELHRDEHGAVTGYVGVAVNGADADLQTVAVAPARRGEGLGRRLLGRAAELARAGGARRLHLEVREDNTPAAELYGSAGFRPVGRRPGYYAPAAPGGDRVAAVTMHADLPLAGAAPVRAGSAPLGGHGSVAR